MNGALNGALQGIFIIAMLVLFIGTTLWAWSNKRKSTFDAAAKLPLEDEDQTEVKS